MARTGSRTRFRCPLELDLATVAPSVAGPRRPQDRVILPDLPANFRAAFPSVAPSASTQEAEDRLTDEGGTTGATDDGSVSVEVGGRHGTIRSGSVAIAAITSCTNTSNPTVMVGAGLLARNAVARGLTVGPTVKTSLAPGSKAVTGYLEAAGLMAPLEALGFALAGYGCTTCIGNSGPLEPEGSPPRSRSTTWWSPRSCPATATSRAGSIRWPGRAISPRRRWSSRSRWPGGSTST